MPYLPTDPMRFFRDIYSLPSKTQALKPDSDSQPPARPISTAPSNPSESDRLKRAIVTDVGVSITQTYACSPFDVLKTYTQLGKKGPPLSLRLYSMALGLMRWPNQVHTLLKVFLLMMPQIIQA